MGAIEDYLSATVALMERNRGNRYNGWVSTAEFVLHHGRQWKPTPLPADIKPMQLGQCFRNAANMALGLQRNEYIYCEGYAVSVFPLPHAWCVDLNGNVIDPTWAHRGRKIAPLGVEYFGIAFKSMYLQEALFKQKYYGLIDAWREDWPLLRAPVEHWKHNINTKLVYERV